MPARLQRRFQEWYPMALGAGERRGVDPLLILAVLDRETTCGKSPLLDKLGPSGTGDHAARRWSRYEKRADAHNFKVWTADDGVALCLPADGRGWGRGLGQIDYAAHTEWCLHKLADDRYAWEDPVLNVDKVGEILRFNLDVFGADEFFAACAYNAGAARVQHALLSLSAPSTQFKRQHAADEVTTGKNYGSDVIARRHRLRDALNTPLSDDEEETKS